MWLAVDIMERTILRIREVLKFLMEINFRHMPRARNADISYGLTSIRNTYMTQIFNFSIQFNLIQFNFFIPYTGHLIYASILKKKKTERGKVVGIEALVHFHKIILKHRQ